MPDLPHSYRRRAILAGGGAALMWPLAAHGGRPAQPIVSPIAYQGHRLWLAAALNGQPKPYLFVVDTGAGFSYIRPEIATALDLTVIGGHVVGGVGGRTAQGTRYAASQVVFGGGIRQDDVVFDGYDFGRGIPADAAGLFSAGLFTTRDSDIDFARGEWRLWPSGRPDRDGMTRLPAMILGSGTPAARIVATAFLDGHAYRLILDTGAPGDIVLFPAASKRSGLFADDVPFAPEISSGFGGRAARLSHRVRARSFQFGPIAIDRPLVTAMDPRQPLDMGHDGLIGIEMLRLLTLSTDVRAAALWASRNDTPPATPTYRRAGLWLDKAPSGAAVVAAVGTGSPAAGAGLRSGDTIAQPATFEAALKAIGGPVGRAVSLQIVRDGAPLDIRYTLADYL